MKDSFIAFLKEKDIHFDTPDDTLVTFSSDGLNFLFQYRKEDDPQFIRLLLPNVEDVNGGENGVFKRMIDISSSIKVVKSIVLNNEVWLSTEQFMTSKENISQVFDRMIAVMKLAYTNYANAAVRKTEHKTDESSNA